MCVRACGGVGSEGYFLLSRKLAAQSPNFCDLLQGRGAVVYISMMCMLIEMIHVSVTVPNGTIVVWGILFGGVHPVFISMMCM